MSPDSERMYRHFTEREVAEPYKEPLADVFELYRVAAETICSKIAAGPERTVALRKLLESRDSAIRAKLNPGA